MEDLLYAVGVIGFIVLAAVLMIPIGGNLWEQYKRIKRKKK